MSQSERLVWLCEELSVPYELKTYNRAPILAPAEFKALHPQGTAPVIQEGDLTMAESGACVEYISHKYGNGRLFLSPSHPNYADFLYWWHWAPGTLQAAVVRNMSTAMFAVPADHPAILFARGRLTNALQMLDGRLEGNEWLAGSEFTVADIMAVVPLSSMRYFYPYDLSPYPNIVSYLQRVGEREAYKRAMKKADPDMALALGAEPPKRNENMRHLAAGK
jgi:glutathione S-transferase